jgi:hypothetical protein
MNQEQTTRLVNRARANHEEILDCTSALAFGLEEARERLLGVEIACDEGEPVKLGPIDRQLALMHATAEHLCRRLGLIFDDLIDDETPEQHRVSVQLSRDEHVVIEQAAAAAGKTPDELIGELIHERIQRAAHRIVKEGDDE